ncbi:MAG: nickel-dependent lactate racemase [Thermodesulfobacteriota bacterium]
MKERLITLRYGRKVLSFNIPSDNLLGIVTPGEIHPPVNTFGLIDSVLNTPTGSPPFDEIFRGGEKITVVASDITRYTGSEIYLPIMINRLNRIGISDKDINIVFALGIHRQQLPLEHRVIVGDEVYKRINVCDHNAFDSKNLVPLGKTDMGTRVEVSRLVAEADKVILTGTIGFHYLAGFGGGRKGIMPGVASFDSCLDLHLLALNPPEVGGRHHMVKTGVLKGNPFHHAMIQACGMLDYVFLFNTILSPTKEIIEVVAGDYLSAHQQGCNFLLSNFSPEFNEKADLVIVSCGGFPKDINFIQAHKSIDYAINILKDNGIMIVLAECSEGFGNSTFLNWFIYDDLMDFESALRGNFEINGQTAFSTLIKAKKVKIILISELASEDVERMSIIPADSIDQAVSMAYEMLGKTPSTYIIPDGGSVLPMVRGAA